MCHCEIQSINQEHAAVSLTKRIYQCKVTCDIRSTSPWEASLYWSANSISIPGLQLTQSTNFPSLKYFSRGCTHLWLFFSGTYNCYLILTMIEEKGKAERDILKVKIPLILLYLTVQNKVLQSETPQATVQAYHWIHPLVCYMYHKYTQYIRVYVYMCMVSLFYVIHNNTIQAPLHYIYLHRYITYMTIYLHYPLLIGNSIKRSLKLYCKRYI